MILEEANFQSRYSATGGIMQMNLRFAMRSKPIPVSSNWWLAVIVMLTVLPFSALAGDSASLNEKLMEAAQDGDVPSVTALLGKGANVNSRDKDGWTPLMWAASYDRANVLRLLLEKGADVNARSEAGETALTQAAGYGYTDVMTVLLDSGADVNAQDERGWNALRHAAVERHTDAVSLLKARGAKVTLIIAAILGDMEEAQRLIRSGADLDEKDEDGCTPLIEAIRHENVRVVKLLLDHGADPNETDNEDGTALMMAALTGQLQVARLLLAKGADVNATDIIGWTALSNAQGSKHRAVEFVLKEAGALDRWTDSGERAPTTAASKKKRKDKLVTGELVALSPERLSIRSDTAPNEVVTVEQRLTTAHAPFRLPRVGEKVQVRYRDKGTAKVADQVRILSEHQAPASKHLPPYPSTPEGVVEAFVNAGLVNESIPVEEMRSCTEMVDAQSKYLLGDEDLQANRTSRVMDPRAPWGPNGIRYHIAAGFEIGEVTSDQNKATVKVLFRRLGWIHHMPFDIGECRSSTSPDGPEATPSGLVEAMMKVIARREGRAWDKDACAILHITNDTQEVSYHLAKPGTFWVITDFYEPHISVTSAIKWLRCQLRHIPGVQKAYPSQEQAIQMRGHITTLEQQLNK